MKNNLKSRPKYEFLFKLVIKLMCNLKCLKPPLTALISLFRNKQVCTEYFIRPTAATVMLLK